MYTILQSIKYKLIILRWRKPDAAPKFWSPERHAWYVELALHVACLCRASRARRAQHHDDLPHLAPCGWCLRRRRAARSLLSRFAQLSKERRPRRRWRCLAGHFRRAPRGGRPRTAGRLQPGSNAHAHDTSGAALPMRRSAKKREWFAWWVGLFPSFRILGRAPGRHHRGRTARSHERDLAGILAPGRACAATSGRSGARPHLRTRPPAACCC